MKTKSIKTQAEVEAAIDAGGNIHGRPSIIELTTHDGSPRQVRIGNLIVKGDYGISIQQVIDREEVTRFKVSYKSELLGDYENFHEHVSDAAAERRKLEGLFAKNPGIKLEKMKVAIDDKGEVMQELELIETISATDETVPF